MVDAPRLRQLHSAGLFEVHLCTKPWDVVLFDSRTVHAGRTARAPSRGGWRLAAYVCMCPRRMLSADGFARRRRAFEEVETTTHWQNARFCPPRRCGPDDGVQRVPAWVAASLPRLVGLE